MKYNIEGGGGGGEGEEDACCTVICVFWFGESAFQRSETKFEKKKLKKMGLVGSDSEILRKKIRKILFF